MAGRKLFYLSFLGKMPQSYTVFVQAKNLEGHYSRQRESNANSAPPMLSHNLVLNLSYLTGNAPMSKTIKKLTFCEKSAFLYYFL